MTPEVRKLLTTVGIIVVAMIAGYLARKARLASERMAKVLMTLVVVVGYTPVGFLSIWGLGRIDPAYTWLPVLGAVHWVLMAGAGLGVGRLLARERPEVGLMGLAAGAGNTGFTMGGFIIYLLLGHQALGLMSIYCLMWTPMMVLLLYPIARHYSPSERPAPLGRLMLRSLFDWRSVGLPVAITGLLLNVSGVPRPGAIAQWRVVDILMYSVTATAYFSIGLRLHASHVLSAWRHIAALAGLRFVLGTLLGLGLLAATLATPWPLEALAQRVFLIECCVPTAITMVAVCNMFGVQPREASVLFIANTMMYLVLVLPVVVLLAG